MKVVFICQAVDSADPILASTLQWVKAFAKAPRVEHITVITLRSGSFSLPDNVEVWAIRGRNRIITLGRFYKNVLIALRKGIDCFFIYQGGPYPALLLPFKWLLRKPVFQWKAHPVITLPMRFYAKYCDTMVFTSTRNAFPLDLPNVKIVGQGIDTSQFRMLPLSKTGDLVTVGRVSPIKNIDEMIKMLAFCRRKYGKSYKLDVYGPICDKNYYEYLRDLIDVMGIKDLVTFHGPVNHEQIPEILNRYNAFLFFCGGALGRSAVEAMACGLPVISTNPCVEEILPEWLKPILMAPKDAPDDQCKKVIQLFSMQESELARIRNALRDIVIQNHSIQHLISKILREMELCL